MAVLHSPQECLETGPTPARVGADVVVVELCDNAPTEALSEGLAFLALAGDAETFAGRVEADTGVNRGPDRGLRGVCHAREYSARP